MPTRHLRRVTHRDVKTHYTVSEMLECGHRFESLVLLTDPLTAKWRTCPTCAAQDKKVLSFPKKSAPSPQKQAWWRKDAA